MPGTPIRIGRAHEPGRQSRGQIPGGHLTFSGEVPDKTIEQIQAGGP